METLLILSVFLLTTILSAFIVIKLSTPKVDKRKL